MRNSRKTIMRGGYKQIRSDSCIRRTSTSNNRNHVTLHLMLLKYECRFGAHFSTVRGCEGCCAIESRQRCRYPTNLAALWIPWRILRHIIWPRFATLMTILFNARKRNKWKFLDDFDQSDYNFVYKPRFFSIFSRLCLLVCVRRFHI